LQARYAREAEKLTSPFGSAKPSFCMGDLVNLRTARKRAKRREAEQAAASNRLDHGRTKAERKLEQFRGDRARRNFDQHRIETGEGQ